MVTNILDKVIYFLDKVNGKYFSAIRSSIEKESDTVISSSKELAEKLAEKMNAFESEIKNLNETAQNALQENKKQAEELAEKQSEIESLREAIHKFQQKNEKLTEELNKSQNEATEDTAKENIEKTIRKLVDIMDIIGDSDKLDKSMKNIKNKALEALAISNIEPITGMGGVFDIKFQSIEGIQPTDDNSLNNIICAEVSPGYRIGKNCLRKQKVIIYSIND